MRQEWIDLLPLVRKPARYIGKEVNSIKKDLDKVRLKFALAFPDIYEVGMSHLGIQILYSILNSEAEVACERGVLPGVRHGRNNARERDCSLIPGVISAF